MTTLKQLSFITFLVSLFFLSMLWLAQAQTTPVKINEVAWAGSAASSFDEYIELKGTAGQDLTGWRLAAVDGTPSLTLTGAISVTGFYLLERSDDNSVASVPAEQIYTGSLADDGEHLQLFDNLGKLVDEINGAAGWPAGDKSPQRVALERIGSEFVTNDCVITSGALDANGGTICGSPGAENQEPQSVNAVRFVETVTAVAPGETKPFVAQAWNSSGEAPEGSTMRFSIVSTGSQIISIAPLTATINASGTATVEVTGLTTGTAVIVAQWFGNLGGVEVQVEYPVSALGGNNLYLPLIIKGGAATAALPPRSALPQSPPEEE
jgi:hypothetical protein